MDDIASQLQLMMDMPPEAIHSAFEDYFSDH